MNTELILEAYLQCALWSCTTEDDACLGDRYEIHNIAPESAEKARADVAVFLCKNVADLLASGLDEGEIGHNLWLTRNGHGTGFWDMDLGATGDTLSDACRALPEVCLYVGDDGRLHL